MVEKVKTLPRAGLRLRNSPFDGNVISVLPRHSRLTVLDRETWLRVRTETGETGFVLGDYVEPESETDEQPPPPATIITYLPRHNAIRSGDAVRIDEDFEPAMAKIEATAARNQCHLYIVSALRRPQQPLAGAIVHPARMSNHFIGHAIDFNVIFDDSWFNSVRLADFDALPGPVQAFLNEIDENEEFGLRWGGRFLTPDPVHIDDAFNRREESRYSEKLMAIWGHRVV